MNNTSKFYQRLIDIQQKAPFYSVARMFIDMRDLVDEAEQNEVALQAKYKAVCAELEEAHNEIERLKPKWTLCSDELPPVGEMVWVIGKEGWDNDTPWVFIPDDLENLEESSIKWSPCRPPEAE